MKAAIYYFSGTGNSLAAARAIAAKTGAALIPLASVAGGKKIAPSADTVGIVFPNYNGELPPIVERFAGALDNLDGKYVFAVCTYGHGYGNTLKKLARLIRERGGRLAARYGIHLPQSAFAKPWENGRLLAAGMARRAQIIGDKAARKASGRFVSIMFLHAIEVPLRALTRPLILKNSRTISQSPPTATLGEAMAAADRSFSSTDACDSCGICGRVCPVKNIKLAAGRPEWLHHCENCLACYNWCPNEAILGRIAQSGYHYRHPDMKAQDFFRKE
jgi:ferredoxin/flavodoxin